MKRLAITLLLLVLLPALVAGVTRNPRAPLTNYPLMTGMEEIHVPVALPPYPNSPELDDEDVIGDTVTVGTTWWDNQHNGTIGRMIEKDDSGCVHLAWMKGMEASPNGPRHVFYNAILPNGTQLFPWTGYQIDASARAGYVTIDASWVYNQGIMGYAAFPAFHEITTGSTYHAAVGADFIPHIGAFMVYEPEWLYEFGMPMELIWPKMQFDRNNVMHIISTEYVPFAGEPMRQYYTPGTYDYSSGMPVITFPESPDSSFRMIDWTMTIAGDVATSEVSDRIAFGWTHSRDIETQWDNDIHILIDEDGRNPDFSQAFNLTNFIPPDLSWLPDTLMADMDTLRAYDDMCLFFDQDDWLHVAFTTPSYFALEGFTYWCSSIVWHWSEQFPNEFKVVHNAFDVWWWSPGYGWMGEGVDCGAWNVKAQRPSLGQDPNTGYLYCMYQVYDTDTLRLSHADYPSGEVYVSVSTDGGWNWSVGTNVTSTRSPNNAAAGQCKSELTTSMAKQVDGYCRITYVYDLDAGSIAQAEGFATDSPVKYHKVPVGLIPTTPLVVQNVPFHVQQGSGAPAVSIDLTPYGTPIEIPPVGGAFNYNISAHNNTSTPQDIDCWCMITLPNGSQYGPVLGPVNVTLAGGATLSRDRSQWVPGYAPAGRYSYNAYVGDYPGSIMDQDSFPFSKLAGQDGAGIGEWANTGESLADLTVPQDGQGEACLAPTKFALHPCSPNPCNPSTVLTYELPVASFVELAAYDVSGCRVASLVEGWRMAGTHEASFDGSRLASGIYFAKLTAADYSQVQKMVLMK